MNKDPEGATQQAAGMILEKSGQLYPISSVLGLDGAFKKSLMFLLNLAWKSRFHLPVLIAVGFMVLDVRMQLEINVDIQVRHVHDQNGDDEDDDDDEDELEDDGEESDDGNSSDNSHLDVAEIEVEDVSKLTAELLQREHVC